MTDATLQTGVTAVTTRRSSKRFFRRLIPAATMLTFLLVWEAAVRILHIPIYMLPPPSAVLHEVVAQHAYFLKHAIATTWAIAWPNSVPGKNESSHNATC